MKLASIEIIKNLKPHPNADRLEIGEVLDWQVVVEKDLHKENDKIIFVQIDTIVPKAPWSEFLVDKNNPEKPIRIKNVKLRGAYSSGIVLPINQFPDFIDAAIGLDVTTQLDVKKYVKELPTNLSGENVGEFPTSQATKTDEDNGLSDPDLVKEVFNQKHLTITQKLDGTSITILVKDGIITEVCSRNLSKKDTLESEYWKAARKLNFPKGWSGVIQGELCGTGIQKNPLKLEDRKIFVFQIKENNSYYTFAEMEKFCYEVLKCDTVPLLCYIDLDKEEWDIHKLQDMADKQKYSSGYDGEGIVVRPSSYMTSYSSRRPLGFKLINRNYKD